MANSASQIKLARECLRYWAWDYLSEPRIPREPNTNAELGKAVHAVAENYHARGQAPDRDTPAGAVFMPALAWVPRPGTGRTEGGFDLTVSGVEYMGYIDLEVQARDLPSVPDNETAPAIVDYKSVKSLDKRRMLKGPGEFMNDPQAILYAARTLVKHRDADRVLLRWLYLRTEGSPKAAPQDCLVSRAEVEDAFGRIVHPIAAHLDALRVEKPHPKDLTPTPSRCMKYGKAYPCPHIARCELTAKEQLIMGSSLLEKLRAKQQAATTAASEPAKAEPAPEAKSEPAPEKGVNPPESPKRARQTRIAPEKSPADEGVVRQAAIADQEREDAELGRAVRVLMRAFKGA